MSNLPTVPEQFMGEYIALFREAIDCRRIIEEERTKQTAIVAQKEVILAQAEREIVRLEEQIRMALGREEARFKFMDATTAQTAELIKAGQFELADQFSQRVYDIISQMRVSDITDIGNDAQYRGSFKLIEK